MARQANGTYIQPANTAAVSGQTISSTAFNTLITDVGTEITNSLDRQGRSAMQAALPMGNNKITGLATPTVSTDAATKAYVDGFTIPDKAVTLQKFYHPSSASILLGTDSNAALTITGAANNGSGAIRLTVASTSTFSTGQSKTVSDVTGTTEANGTWTITVVDGTHIDLQGSTFTNTYVSGGTIGGGVEEITLGSGLSLSGSILSASLSATSVPGFLSGLTLSTAGASSTFSVAVGGANDVSSGGLLTLSSAISKTTASWAVGTGNGALDTGSIATSTWYHVFLIKRTDTGVVDILISTSASTPTMPTSYTLKRRIGSLLTNGSNQWVKFYQVGDEFIWDAPPVDQNLSSTPNGLYQISVPPGVSVMARMNMNMRSTSAGGAVLVHSPLTSNQSIVNGDVTSVAPVANLDNYSQINVMTDTSRQVRAIGNGTGSFTWVLATVGWNDARGK